MEPNQHPLIHRLLLELERQLTSESHAPPRVSEAIGIFRILQEVADWND